MGILEHLPSVPQKDILKSGRREEKKRIHHTIYCSFEVDANDFWLSLAQRRDAILCSNAFQDSRVPLELCENHQFSKCTPPPSFKHTHTHIWPSERPLGPL